MKTLCLDVMKHIFIATMVPFLLGCQACGSSTASVDANPCPLEVALPWPTPTQSATIVFDRDGNTLLENVDIALRTDADQNELLSEPVVATLGPNDYILVYGMSPGDRTGFARFSLPAPSAQAQKPSLSSPRRARRLARAPKRCQVREIMALLSNPRRETPIWDPN